MTRHDDDLSINLSIYLFGNSSLCNLHIHFLLLVLVFILYGLCVCVMCFDYHYFSSVSGFLVFSINLFIFVLWSC